MNIKNLILLTLTMSAGSGIAGAATLDTVRKSNGGLPASRLQFQVLAASPVKTAEFARFEATPVRIKKAAVDQGRAISPNQAEVLGKKMK